MTWWDWTAAWARPAIPVTAAILLLLGALLALDGTPRRSAGATDALSRRDVLAQLVAGDLPEGEALDLVLGRTGRDGLVDGVMGGD